MSRPKNMHRKAQLPLASVLNLRDCLSGNSRLYLFVIVGLSLVLFLSPLTWFMGQLVIEPFNAVLVLILPIAWYFRRQSTLRVKPLSYSLLPTLLFGVFVVAYVLNENFLGVHIFSAVLFLGAAYGLLGLILSGQQWRGLFVPFCLFVLVLPFEGYLDVYLGFPLRLLCAEWTGEILRIGGIASITSESIIVIEEKSAYVDLACSGIKGIWAGGIFYLLLSVIEGHKVTWRWCAIGLAFVACLIMANVLRITCLVLLSLVADQAWLADLVHQGIGLLGFGLSCILAWAGLRLWLKRSCSDLDHVDGPRTESTFFPLLLTTGLLLSVWVHQPYRPIALDAVSNVRLPSEFQSQRIDLSDYEKEFFARNSASVSKLRFELGDLTGSVLLVNSRYWKAQHKPHNCYMGQGLSLGFEGLWLLKEEQAVRFIQIENASKTAVYWFQSADKLTPDYSARILNGIVSPNTTWLMISILFDQRVGEKQVENLLLLIQKSIDKQLNGGGV